MAAGWCTPPLLKCKHPSGVAPISSDGETYFLKVPKGAVDEVSLPVPRSLKEAGVSQVVAPIPAIRSPKPWAVAGDYALIV